MINNYIPDSNSQERATIMSFASLFRNILIFMLAVPAGGTSGEKTVVGWALPASLLLITAIIGNFVLRNKKEGVTRRKQ